MLVNISNISNMFKFYKFITLILLCISTLSTSNICKEDVITLNNTNHVSILGSIEPSSVTHFIKSIEKIDPAITDIYVYINSGGGYVDSGEQIIQYMRYKQYLNYTMSCIAHTALSMAFHIYQHCDRRIILPTSKIMQHQMSLQVEGNLENINNYLYMLNKINNRLIELESDRLNITPDEYSRKTSSDWWLYGIDILESNTGDCLIQAIGCDKDLINTEDNQLSNNLFQIKLNNPSSKCPLLND